VQADSERRARQAQFERELAAAREGLTKRYGWTEITDTVIDDALAEANLGARDEKFVWRFCCFLLCPCLTRKLCVSVQKCAQQSRYVQDSLLLDGAACVGFHPTMVERP
jgi:hypothetical protein